MTKRRILFCGDAGVPSGFARATHHIVDALAPEFDVHILGLNFKGEPVQPDGTAWPYKIWPCYPGGDAFGLGRMQELCEALGPSLVIVQQDPWNFQAYLQLVKNVPVMGIVAVDGKCCRGTELNGLEHAVFWTQFGLNEARAGGYTGDGSVIPLGVDLNIYTLQDKAAARERLSLPRILEMRGLPEDTFIVGSVGRNQQRKRLDLTIQYFADWVHSRKVSDAALWLHVAPTGDDAYDLSLLAKYYGIADRIMVPNIAIGRGITEQHLARVYGIFDVLLSTSQGEGWSLPTQEAMACGTPCIVPNWSALGEWAKDAALQVPCTGTAATPPRGITTIGGIMDEGACITALDDMYADRELRMQYSGKGLMCVQQPQYRWENIGRAYLELVRSVVNRQPVEAVTV